MYDVCRTAYRKADGGLSRPNLKLAKTQVNEKGHGQDVSQDNL